MLQKTFIYLSLAMLLSQCTPNASKPADVPQHLTHFQVDNIRLHDGVPLAMQFDLRWQVDDPDMYGRLHVASDSFPKMLMLPRAEEALRTLAHGFYSVDSVFFSQRNFFLQSAKDALRSNLQKDGITVQDIIIKSLSFPQSYVSAMEAAGLQRQELERIKRQTTVAIAEAEAERRKTEAMSRVQIAQEEANARMRDIQASTEDRRRAAEVARAETEVQIEAKKSVIAADRQRQMNQVEIEKASQQQELELKKVRQSDEAEILRARELAKVYVDNPGYAGFVVNKELASKVNIAVLPAGQDHGVLNHFLEQNFQEKKN